MSVKTKPKTRQASADPTGTQPIRAAFRGESGRRINLVRKLLSIVIVDQDLMGLSRKAVLSPSQHIQFFASAVGFPADYRLKMFSDWFNGVLYQHVVADGLWTESYLRAAFQRGMKDAAADLSVPPQPFFVMNELFTQEARNELSGIVDATLQQTTRVVSSALLGKHSPQQLYRALVGRLEKITSLRMQALANFMTVRVYNNAKLDFYAGNNVMLVGINPEAKLVRQHTHTHDAVNRNLVWVLTAGDDDVCLQCENISDDGPYDLATARNLIPAHPNCRCAFVPFGDERFNPVHDSAVPVFARLHLKDEQGGGNPNHEAKGSEKGGQFAKGHGPAGAEGGGDDKPLTGGEGQVNPDAVGGDDWNRETMTRLANEWSAAKPKVEALLETLKVGEDSEIPVDGSEGDDDAEQFPSGESWDTIGDDLQEKTKDEFIEHNLDSEVDSQTDYWKQEVAPESVSEDWMNKTTDYLNSVEVGHAQGLAGPDEELEEPGADESNQDDDVFNKRARIMINEGIDDARRLIAERRKKGSDLQQIPITNEQLFAALEAQTVNYKFRIVLDPKKISVEHLTEEQQDLFPSGLKMTDEEKELVEDAITAKFQYGIEQEIEGLDAPDYIHDQAKESLAEMFGEMGDEEKFNTAQTYFPNELKSMGEDNADVIGGGGGPLVEPEHYDPMGQDGGSKVDYARTRKVGLNLSVHRAAQIMVERGIANPALAMKAARSLDSRVWRDWKDSSTSSVGQLLQVACADEFGARLRLDSLTDSVDNIRKVAPNIGVTYEAFKAYVRGKWEATQFLLDKVGAEKVRVYRGIRMYEAYDDKTPVEEHVRANGTFNLLPTLQVVRNGAASTTVNPDIANGWGGSGSSRVVLRAEVPPTAILSVPAYGQNVHKEQEVVVMGTAWHGWDAWKAKAPFFETIPLGAGRMAAMKKAMTQAEIHEQMKEAEGNTGNSAALPVTGGIKTLKMSGNMKTVQLETKDFNEAHEAKGSSKGGQFAKGHGAVGGSAQQQQRQAPQTFVSPNIANLSFEQAEQSVNSDRQKVFLKAAHQVDTALGLKSAENRTVIGAWSDGAENSTLCVMPGADYETAKVAAAMKGHLADQKAVIVFQPDENGSNFMATFKATGDLADIHAKMLKSGIENHTLEPEQGGATVHVFGFDQETLDKVSAASKQYGNSFDVVTGTGEFVGTEKQDGTDREQRDDARRVYEKVIADAARQRPEQNIASIWKGLRADWGANLQEVIRPDIRTSMAREPSDPALALQPVKTVQELYLKSRAAEKSFIADVEEIVSKTGGSSKYAFDDKNGTTLKKIDSTLRKMRDETGNDPRLIRDVLRATVINDTVVESRKAAAEFIGMMGDRIIRVKDRFVMPMGSYRDLMINYRTENGVIAEVQFNTGKMLAAKDVGHKLYEESRLLAGKMKRGELGRMQAALEINRLNTASEQVYSGAYKASGNGRGWQNQLH